MDWIVLRNTGDRVFLARGLELMEVDRPNPMSRLEFSELFAVNCTVDDDTITTVTKGFR